MVGAPDLLYESLGEFGAVLLVGLEIGSVDDIVEKDADLQSDLIDIAHLLKLELRSLPQIPQHDIDMVIGMEEPPILTVVLNHNIPPLSAHQMVLLLLSSRDLIDPINQLEPDLLILGVFFDCESVLGQDVSADLCGGDLVLD